MKKVAIALLCIASSLLGGGDVPILVFNTGKLIVWNDSMVPKRVYQGLGTKSPSCSVIPCNGSELFESEERMVISIVLTPSNRIKIALYKEDSRNENEDEDEEQSPSFSQLSISELLEKQRGE